MVSSIFTFELKVLVPENRDDCILEIKPISKPESDHPGLPDPGDEVLSANDGPEGFLWKASDHSPHNLVILTPKEYEFARVFATLKGGSKERLEYKGRSNGERQTWRGSRPPKSYKNNQIVDAYTKGSEKVVRWKIGKARRRHD